MAEAAADPAGSSRTIANLLLIVLALVLVAAAGLFFTGGASAVRGDPRAEALSRTYAQVTRAARQESLAFLTVDYRDMDPLVSQVLAGATGPFKKQYARAGAKLKASAREARADSIATVLSVGVGVIGDRKVVVFVAANAQVSNVSTKGKPQPRYYRLKLTMIRKGHRWLTSNLKFVG